MNKLFSEKLIKKIIEAKSIVVLVGKEISYESGIPSPEEMEYEGHSYNELAKIDSFKENPLLVWKWYRWRRKIVSGVIPNLSHYALARFENFCISEKKDFCLITQDVNGLHQRAGSYNLYELHGNIMSNKCINCNEIIADFNIEDDKLPNCSICGNILKAGVLSRGERADSNLMEKAIEASAKCDLFLIFGTNESMTPSAHLLQLAKKNDSYLLEINSQPSQSASIMSEVIIGNKGEIITKILNELEQKRDIAESLNQKIPEGEWKFSKILIVENIQENREKYLLNKEYFGSNKIIYHELNQELKSNSDYIILANIIYCLKDNEAIWKYSICLSLNSLNDLQEKLITIALSNWTQCNIQDLI